MKPISYKQKMGDTKRFCTREGPTGSCLVSILLVCGPHFEEQGPKIFNFTSHYR